MNYCNQIMSSSCQLHRGIDLPNCVAHRREPTNDPVYECQSRSSKLTLASSTQHAALMYLMLCEIIQSLCIPGNTPHLLIIHFITVISLPMSYGNDYIKQLEATTKLE
jgi:hypothetical protein